MTRPLHSRPLTERRKAFLSHLKNLFPFLLLPLNCIGTSLDPCLNAELVLCYCALTTGEHMTCAGVTADLDAPRIWTPGTNPLADLDTPDMVAELLQHSIASFYIQQFIFVFNNSHLYSVKIYLYSIIRICIQ